MISDGVVQRPKFFVWRVAMKTIRCTCGLGRRLARSNGSSCELTTKLTKGNVELASVGPIAFAPEGILLVADPKQASIVAIATGDVSGDSRAAEYAIEKLDEKIAAALGTSSKDMRVVDMVPIRSVARRLCFGSSGALVPRERPSAANQRRRPNRRSCYQERSDRLSQTAQPGSRQIDSPR